MKVALAEVSVVDEIFCQPTAVLSLGRKLVSHDPRAHVYHRVDRCWRIVYQPNGCAGRLTVMNVAFFDRTFPELVYLHFITSTFKATSKSQNFVRTRAVCSSNFTQ